MRRVVNYLTLLLVVSALAACASTPERPARRRIPACLTDPANNVMHCDGNTRPWSEMRGFTCYSIDDVEDLMECR